MTRVLLCGGDTVLVEGLCNSRLEAEDLTFVSCSGEARLPAALAFHRPDVVFLDVPAATAARSIALLQDLVPMPHIVLWGQSVSPHFTFNAIAAGVRGAIPKSASITTVLQCVSSVSAGELWFDKAIFEDVFATLSGSPKRPRW